MATLLGRDWARLWLMGSAVVTTVGAFTSNLTGSKPVTLLGLPTTATSILLLLALTSHRAREYAARGHGRLEDDAGEQPTDVGKRASTEDSPV